ncbi:15012_t:CDS:1, partial [Gigaspora rosea]
SPDNTIYCLTLFTKAWTALTGSLAEDFIKYNKITVYGNENILSSNCFDDYWNANTISNYFTKKRVSFQLEDKSDTMNS